MPTTATTNGDAAAALQGALAAAGYQNDTLSEIARVQLGVANLIQNPVVTGPQTVAGAITGASSILSSSPSAGVGYKVGAGGVNALTGTTKSSAFTLNAVTGKLTFSADALEGYGTASSATWTNSAVASADVIVFNHVSGGTIGKYSFNATCSAGTAMMRIANVSSASLSESVVVQFAVVKGAQA